MTNTNPITHIVRSRSLAGKILAVLFTIVLAFAISSIKAQDSWTQIASPGNTGRTNAVGFAIAGKGYVGTGLDPDYKKDFWSYDPIADTWTQVADFGGTARYAAVAFSVDGKGYVGTGSDSPYSNQLKDFWEYDPTTNTWKKKANLPGAGRRFAVAFSIGDKGYVGTGLDGNALNLKDFWEYDPSTDSWQQKADFGGAARDVAVAFSIGNKGYLGTGIGYKKDFWEYDPEQNTWAQKADFGGSGRQSATGLAIGGRGYIGLGYDGSLKNDFWEYNPASNIWTQKADFGGVGRWNAVGFSIGTEGFIGCGDSFWPNFQNDFFKYDPCFAGYTFYADEDGDGYGDAGIHIIANSCATPVGYVLDSSDCNDLNASINPVAAEACANGIDDNCNGMIDENCCTSAAPTGEGTTAVTATHATTYWDLVPTAIKYKVRYRITGNSIWTTLTTNTNSKKIKDLTPGTTYEWQVKSICGVAGNSNWSAKFNFTTQPQRMREDEAIASLSIYPNPTSSNVTIEFTTSQPQSLTIQLLDVLGREVFSSDEGTISGTFTKQLDLSNLPSGTYFLKVMHDGESEMRKVVIEK